ncbi:MAG: RNB domain-containing ribonuclease [Nitrosomonadales bacterium]|nr:RNB domain-containing ribonuclease [Nitrosomonadales bacterium]
MNIFYEEDGGFKTGTVLADNTTSLQVESISGKRSKIKSANVMLHFKEPSLAEFMARAEAIAADIDTDFLWECCPPDDFGFEELATEYFGHTPTPQEAAGALIRLHTAPMYFYKKGKGRYKSAPPEALKAALAGAEKKRLQAELQARYTAELTRFELPPELAGKLPQLLFKPDRNTLEVKALEAACAATNLSAAHLLHRCGAIPSTHDYHLQRFLSEHFPKGTGFPSVDLASWEELPLATVTAFSIDDASTTEIDDAFSLKKLDNGDWRIGVHIAAPALGMPRGSSGDELAMSRLSTVYMPGDKITMLPDSVVEVFTLNADRICPALSMYLTVQADTLDVLTTESRIERLHIAANLRHDTLEPLFNEESLAAGRLNYAYAPELTLLWQLAQKLEARRGKSSDNSNQQVDYTFDIKDDRISIGIRRRGSPIDKVVSELMIFVNSEWGKLLADNNYTAIYRTQNNGKVKMSSVPAPHQGLGVAQYAWSSSPLRRYVDLLNQRQLIALLRGDAPVYQRNDTMLFAAMRDFDQMYGIYNDFQRDMERYWCLRWLQQEQVQEIDAQVIRENLVRMDGIPLIGRVPSLPELPGNTRVTLEITAVDLLDLGFEARFVKAEEATA